MVSEVVNVSNTYDTKIINTVSETPYIVKPVYKGQSLGITKMALVNRWPLFVASETTYPMFTGRFKTGLCGQETNTRRCPYAQI